MGIDFCCGGQKPLAEACQEKSIDAGTLVQLLAAQKELGEHAGPQTDWTKESLTALADHIEATHHQYLREEMPRLAALLNKVASVHGANHPELARLEPVYAALFNELMSHMGKEEKILFPAIRKLEAGQNEQDRNCFGTLANPIRVMVMEHESAGENLSQLNRLSGGYAVPADGCGSYKALMDGLRQLEEDTHLHIHKENNILFPRAMALEEAGARGSVYRQIRDGFRLTRHMLPQLQGSEDERTAFSRSRAFVLSHPIECW